MMCQIYFEARIILTKENIFLIRNAKYESDIDFFINQQSFEIPYYKMSKIPLYIPRNILYYNQIYIFISGPRAIQFGHGWKWQPNGRGL